MVARAMSWWSTVVISLSAPRDPERRWLPRWRYTIRMIDRAIAASAAASPMMNSTMIWPMAGSGADEVVERQEVDARRVEHQLDADEDRDEVAPGEHAVEPEAEEDEGEEEPARGASCVSVLIAAGSGSSSRGEAIVIAPTIASSRTTESSLEDDVEVGRAGRVRSPRPTTASSGEVSGAAANVPRRDDPGRRPTKNATAHEAGERRGGRSRPAAPASRAVESITREDHGDGDAADVDQDLHRGHERAAQDEERAGHADRARSPSPKIACTMFGCGDGEHGARDGDQHDEAAAIMPSPPLGPAVRTRAVAGRPALVRGFLRGLAPWPAAALASALPSRPPPSPRRLAPLDEVRAPRARGTRRAGRRSSCRSSPASS